MDYEENEITNCRVDRIKGRKYHPYRNAIDRKRWCLYRGRIVYREERMRQETEERRRIDEENHQK